MEESRCFPRTAKEPRTHESETKHAKRLLPHILKVEKFFEQLMFSINNGETQVTPNTKYLLCACHSKLIRLKKGLELLSSKKK
jgi:hypothetical protein